MNRYSNAMSGSKNIKERSMVLGKYHVPFVWNKYLLTKNIWYYKIIFNTTTPLLSLKLSFMSDEDRINFDIFSVALLAVCQSAHCVLLSVQCFYLRRNQIPSFLLSIRNRKAALRFHENQILSLRISIVQVLHR